jgi:hypothetical protein
MKVLAYASYQDHDVVENHESGEVIEAMLLQPLPTICVIVYISHTFLLTNDDVT